ncbi:MAG TPA: hypothetical protein VF788_11615 [Pseudonocardiaceae bacterium]
MADLVPQHPAQLALVDYLEDSSGDTDRSVRRAAAVANAFGVELGLM